VTSYKSDQRGSTAYKVSANRL